MYTARRSIIIARVAVEFQGHHPPSERTSGLEEVVCMEDEADAIAEATSSRPPGAHEFIAEDLMYRRMVRSTP